MTIEVTNQRPGYNGTYFTPDEQEKMKEGMFYQKPLNTNDPARYYIINCFKKGEKTWQEAFTGAYTTKEDAWKQYLSFFDLKNNTYSKNTVNDLDPLAIEFDAFMPRTQVPGNYTDSVERIVWE